MQLHSNISVDQSPTSDMILALPLSILPWRGSKATLSASRDMNPSSGATGSKRNACTGISRM